MTACIPSPEDLHFLEDRLYEYNAAQTGKDDGELFGVFIRDDQNEIVAGMTGWTWASACEISQVWVHPSCREQGYGSRLLKAAEDKAREKRCQIIYLSSYSFQAPRFYQKFGYELAYELKDFPPGHQYCFLVKRLPELASQ